jgi:glycosyltransferase involved in cell wall biosynthesis
MIPRAVAKRKAHKIAILTSQPIIDQSPLFRRMGGDPSFDLTVYFCCGNEKKAKKDRQFGVPIARDSSLLDGYSHKFLKNFSFRPYDSFLGQINPGILGELARNKYDALIVFGWNSFSNILVFIWAFISKTPVLLRGESPLNQEIIKSKWKLAIKKFFFKKTLFPRIGAFLCIGKENADFYRFYGVPENKLFFSPYAVDNDYLIKRGKELKNKSFELKNKLDIKKDDVVIFFAGKLIDKKRPMDLLRAYEILSAERKTLGISLVFAGEGFLRKSLENYAVKNNLKNVYFPGFKSQGQLLEYYALADIFVLPSGPGETWGLVVNEAMCFSLPVIVSDMVGCGPDLVRHGANGYVFPVGNVGKMAEYLSELANDGKKRKKFGEISLSAVMEYNYGKAVMGTKEALDYLSQ